MTVKVWVNLLPTTLSAVRSSIDIQRENIVKLRVTVLFLLLSLCFVTLAAAEMDLGKAIKIGSGKTLVIEFTDPDCPYCRKGAEFFRNRQDVTLYVFLTPLAIHPQAKEKAQYILSASDKAKAYDEVLSGKLDGHKPAGITAEGTKLLEEHMAIAKAAKADSTPTFIICGRIIEGFNPQRLEAALGK